MHSSPSKATTHTLERALTILRAFDGSTAPLSHSELVRRTGYSKASVSRIASTLVSLGYLGRDADGVRFRIGLRGPSLGHTYRANSPIAALARPIMQRFADEHDLSVAIGIADGTEMLYIEYCKSPSTRTLCFAVGRRLQMEVSAMGRAWLWDQPEQDRQDLLERIKGRATEQSLERTRRAFEHLDTEGYCRVVGEYHPDIWGAAVPLRLGRPGMAMSLSCAGMMPALPAGEIREVIAPALKDTAHRLRLALGDVDSGLF